MAQTQTVQIGPGACEKCRTGFVVRDSGDPWCLNCGFVKYPHGIIGGEEITVLGHIADVMPWELGDIAEGDYHDEGVWKRSLSDRPVTEKASPVEETATHRQYRVLAEGLEERAATLPQGRERKTMEDTARDIRREMERV